ncbi:MAG: tetratricopeptide repeat protein [Elusimicrobiota bacterium]
MGKQWVRQEAKKNELAQVMDSALHWVRFHQQTAAWTLVAVLGIAIAGATMSYRILQAREQSWGKLAIAQSLAYGGQVEPAFQQISALSSEHPGSVAAGYGMLLEGDIRFQQEKFKEAAEVYRHLADEPAHKSLAPLALADLGVVQEAAGDCKAAVEADQRFLDSFQDHFLAPQVHASLARCLGALGEAEKAKATLERIAFLYPDTPWVDWAKSRLK